MKRSKLTDRLKRLDKGTPKNYPEVIIVDESEGETMESKIAQYKIPPEEVKNIVWIIDDIK